MTPTSVLRTFHTSVIRELPRSVLVALFSFTAIDKVIHFSGFVTAVRSYEVVPIYISYSAAIFFIIAEFAIAFGLLTKRWRRAASLAAILLLSLFTTVYLVVRPADICGCWFTLTLSPGGYFHILQNVIFIGLAALTWLDSFERCHSTAAQQSDDGSLKRARELTSN